MPISRTTIVSALVLLAAALLAVALFIAGAMWRTRIMRPRVSHSQFHASISPRRNIRVRVVNGRTEGSELAKTPLDAAMEQTSLSE
jgi:hypothetical protein